MRLFFALLKNARAPQDVQKVPLKVPRIPFGVRTKVSGRGTKRALLSTVQETVNLISALAKNDFKQQHCEEEINKLRKAHQESYEAWQETKRLNQALDIPVGSQLSVTQLNKYLKRFPEPKLGEISSNLQKLDKKKL